MRERSLWAAFLYAAVFVVVGIAAAWPIYQTPTLILVTGVAAVTGGVLGICARVWSWRWPVVVGALSAAWIGLGLALAIPARWADGTVFPAGVLDVLVAPVTGWKDLITVPLPVGEYRNLLVPALLVFLFGAFGIVRLGSMPGKLAVLAAPVAALIPAFGLWFGRTSPSQPLSIGPVTITAPVEIAIGAASMITTVLWLSWRASDERRGALRRAMTAVASQDQVRTRSGAAVRRGVLGAAVIVVAVSAGVLLTPAVSETRERSVLRSALGPDVSVTQARSPLAQYRTNFTDDGYDRELFRVTSTGKLPERIRIATLDWYDGEVYRATDDVGGAFQRVPSRLPADNGETLSARVEISGLGSVWLPTFGSLSQISFDGAEAATYADNFYYDQSTGTAVEAGGLREGMAYTLTGTVAVPRDLRTLESPGVDPVTPAPVHLQRWLEEISPTADGAGLIDAITLLRERGYLSHALTFDTSNPPRWTSDLGDYAFRASAAGHSLGRVDDIFAQLMERQDQATSASDSLVAAPGDDEQFAVAAGLIAQQLGFESRVVVGVRTASDEQLPTCTDGICRGSDVSAWIEVRAGDSWIAVDTTPQHTERVSLRERQQRDPENMTEVRPPSAEEVPPPDPQRQEADTTLPDNRQPVADSAFWATVGWIGVGLLSLLVLLAPFLTVIVAKILRRRSRRHDPDPVRAIAGGWDEYVDGAVDAGLAPPTVETRRELAAVYGTPVAADLAARADRATFGGAALTDGDVASYWELVDQERQQVRSGATFWQRLRAAVSVTSFRRMARQRPRPSE